MRNTRYETAEQAPSLADVDDARRAVRAITTILEAGHYYQTALSVALHPVRMEGDDWLTFDQRMFAAEVARHVPREFGDSALIERLAREHIAGCKRKRLLAAIESVADEIHFAEEFYTATEAELARDPRPPIPPDVFPAESNENQRDRAVAAERRRRSRVIRRATA